MPIPLDAKTIAAFHVPELGPEVSEKLRDGLASVQLVQTAHRLDVLEHWGGVKTFENASVLELGSGQGDMSTVLAVAVSESGGKVIAWDPAPGSYGSPLTLAEAHQVVLSHPDLSSILQFKTDTPLESVLNGSTFTHAVLVHSLYYFASQDTLLETFRTLAQYKPPIKTLCLAEYALTANDMTQVPHLISVLAQSASHALTPNSDSNVRTVLSPRRITELAQEAGWELKPEDEVVFTPSKELQDGGWEAGTVASWPDAEGERASSMNAFKEATASVMRELKGRQEKVQTMPVWCAVLRNRNE